MKNQIVKWQNRGTRNFTMLIEGPMNCKSMFQGLSVCQLYIYWRVYYLSYRRGLNFSRISAVLYCVLFLSRHDTSSCLQNAVLEQVVLSAFYNVSRETINITLTRLFLWCIVKGVIMHPTIQQNSIQLVDWTNQVLECTFYYKHLILMTPQWPVMLTQHVYATNVSLVQAYIHRTGRY